MDVCSKSAGAGPAAKEGEAVSRAAIYIRVSDEEQVKGHSLDFQLADCKEQAERDGFTISDEHIYKEPGVSAKTATKRPEFQKMIAEAKSRPRPFERIYVWKLDRFARNREDAVVYKGLLRQAGIELISVKEPLDKESAAGVLLEGMMEVVAEWYSADLKQKVSRSRQRRVDLGLANGDPPFGYARNPLSQKGSPLPWLKVEAEADAVRQMFEMYATGEHSMAQLADWLTGQGFCTHNKRKDVSKGWITGAAPFTKESVKDMLKNAVFYGAVTYKGEVQSEEGKHEAIIDKPLFERCQGVMRDNPRRPKNWNPKGGRFYPLGAGLLRCAACGQKLIGNHAPGRNKRGYEYYRDVSAIRRLPCPQGGKGTVKAVEVERQLKRLLEVLPQDAQGHVIALLTSSRDDAAERQRQALLQELEARKQRVGIRFEVGELDRDEYVARLSDITTEIEKLKAPAASPAPNPLFWKLREGLLQTVGLGLAWPEARQRDYETFRSTLCELFEAIYVNLETGQIVGVTPQPAFRHFFGEGTAVTWKSSDAYGHFAPKLTEREKGNAPESGGDGWIVATPRGFEAPTN